MDPRYEESIFTNFFLESFLEALQSGISCGHHAGLSSGLSQKLRLFSTKKKSGNWKDATESFRPHECSKCHQEAVQKLIVYSNSISDIGKFMSSAHAQNKVDNRKVLLKILQNEFLGRQGIAFRGHEDVEFG